MTDLKVVDFPTKKLQDDSVDNFVEAYKTGKVSSVLLAYESEGVIKWTHVGMSNIEALGIASLLVTCCSGGFEHVN